VSHPVFKTGSRRITPAVAGSIPALSANFHIHYGPDPKKSMNTSQRALQSLPAIDKLLHKKEVKHLISLYGIDVVKHAARSAIDIFRTQIKSGKPAPSGQEVIENIQHLLLSFTQRSLKKVFNATGIIINTNLGRAPFGEEMTNEVMELLKGYNNLEFDLEKGDRGNRAIHVRELLKYLTGAEDILIVNNCAAAVMFCLRTFAKNKEVIVSRGELVEIGGSFRIPEIMAASDCKMVEVGTTNKTKPEDYKRAVTKKTAMLFKAHKSNYVIRGFTQEVELKDLVKIGNELNIPVMFDQGSGLLRKISHIAFSSEPDIRTCVSTGVDLVCFSGDKLLGGPQAGIIAGKKAFIDRLRKEPMFRALRVCKTTLAFLETACLAYLSDETLLKKSMIFRLLNDKPEHIESKAKKLAGLLSKNSIICEVSDNKVMIGGGSLPEETLASKAVLVRFEKGTKKEQAEFSEQLYSALLLKSEPVVGILVKGKLLLDVLTIEEKDIEKIARIVSEAYAGLSAEP
jgi:L-seryl-tRNA(Ser) seleniumtransferase